MSGPPSSLSILVWVCGPQHFLQIQTCCVCVCLKGQCRKRRVLRIQLDPHHSGFELSFGILSFVCLFCFGPPPHPRHPPLLSLSPSVSPPSVCLLADEFVSLSGSSQTLRHLLPTDTQTDSEITSHWQRLGGRGRVGGGLEETDVQTESPSSGGMGISHTSITLAIRREAAFLLEEFRVQYCDRVQSQLSALISVGKKKKKRANCTHVATSRR